MSTIRLRPVRESWGHYLWRFVIEAIALIVAWLAAISAAAAQQPRIDLLSPGPQGRSGGKRPPVPNFQQLDPDKFFEQFFGAKGGELNDDARLAKVDVSWDEEQRQGQQTFDEFKQRLLAQKDTLVDRGKDVEYLQKLAGLIRPQMQQAARYRQLKVYVTSWKKPEAMVSPGGKLIVTQGMLDAAGSEAALVGVLGHELSHLDRGHLLRRMKQWKLAQQQFSQPAAGFAPDKLLGTMSTMQQLFRRPFGPAEELDADTDGITWSYRLGYDPQALSDVYAAFEKHGLDQPDFLPAFFRTHPPSAERRENLRATIAKLQAARPAARLYLGRENLARRLTRQQREFAE